MPPNQITLGLPAYGYVQTSNARRLIQRRQVRKRMGKLRLKRDENGGRGGVRIKAEGDGDDSDSGQVQFNQLVQGGALKLSPSGFVGAGGFKRMWDVCSSTVRFFGCFCLSGTESPQPYLISENANQVIAYDDPQSLGMKAAFARGAGLRGVNMFDVHGDTDDWALTDAIREGLGL